MCNCNKPKPSAHRPRPLANGSSGAARQSFELIVGGKTATFGSRLEADAANARSGFRGIVRPLPK